MLKSWPLPGQCSGEEPACQCRRQKRYGFNPWVRKIPWRRAWQPTPIFLPGGSHQERSLAGYSPECCKESDSRDLAPGDGTSKWLAREGGAPWMEFILLQKKLHRSLFPSSIWLWWKDHHLGKRASLDTESAGAMILAFPSSGSVMNHCSLFISHLVYGIFW